MMWSVKAFLVGGKVLTLAFSFVTTAQQTTWIELLLNFAYTLFCKDRVAGLGTSWTCDFILTSSDSMKYQQTILIWHFDIMNFDCFLAVPSFIQISWLSFCGNAKSNTSTSVSWPVVPALNDEPLIPLVVASAACQSMRVSASGAACR